MIRVSPRTPDRLFELCGSHVQQSEALLAMIGTCGPYDSGGSAIASKECLQENHGSWLREDD
jgi:hypothetical protein